MSVMVWWYGGWLRWCEIYIYIYMGEGFRDGGGNVMLGMGL